MLEFLFGNESKDDRQRQEEKLRRFEESTQRESAKGWYEVWEQLWTQPRFQRWMYRRQGTTGAEVVRTYIDRLFEAEKIAERLANLPERPDVDTVEKIMADAKALYW